MKKEKKDKHFIKKPFYKGGINAMKAFIKKNIIYPEAALNKKIQGTVYVRYSINYKGLVIDTKIISGIGYGCDEEAARLVKLLQFQIHKNRNIKAIFHKDIQIHFRLPKTINKNPKPSPISSIQYNYTTVKKSPQSLDIPPPKKKGGGYDIIIKY